MALALSVVLLDKVIFVDVKESAPIVQPAILPEVAVNSPALVTAKAVLLLFVIVISPPVIFKLLNSALPSALIAQ
jgi:hypothetical protein